MVGTLEVDTISVLSTSQAGDEVTLDFDMGNGDGKADILNIVRVTVRYVIVRNFETGTDQIHSDGFGHIDQYDTGCDGNDHIQMH